MVRASESLDLVYVGYSDDYETVSSHLKALTHMFTLSLPVFCCLLIFFRSASSVHRESCKETMSR